MAPPLSLGIQATGEAGANVQTADRAREAPARGPHMPVAVKHVTLTFGLDMPHL